MGARNYLIDGVSGTGKTTVAEELERRGYQVIHGDRTLAYYGDPETGAPLEQPALESAADVAAWGNARWIWPVGAVRSLVAERSHAMTFFCGGSRNSRHFIDLFDAVFILDVDIQTLRERLAKRPADEFGGQRVERDLIARMHASREGLPLNGIMVDATAPVGSVVDSILSICGEAGRQSE
ncbi:MAG TPA: AAA family ATPase [Rhizobiaceae bacterium]|nr:AAA family ATPase [Rhizobiaceae bacterium]